MAPTDLRPVTGYGSIRHSDKVHDNVLKKAVKLREERVRRCVAEDLCEEIEDFEHKLGWRMRSRLGLKAVERRALEKTEQRTMGIKIPPEPRPKRPLLLYDYSQSPNVHVTSSPLRSARDVVPRWSRHSSPSSSWNDMSNISRDSLSTPIRAKTAPVAGPLRNSTRLWTPHSMIEPIFLPSSSAHRSAADHIAHAHLAMMFEDARKPPHRLLPPQNLRSLRVGTGDDKANTTSGSFQKSPVNLYSLRMRSVPARPILDPTTRSELEFQRLSLTVAGK